MFGVGTVGVQTSSGLKTISNLFYALNVSQNLLNVGQLWMIAMS